MVTRPSSLPASKQKFAKFKGLQIVARKAVADDKVELRYYFEFQNQRPGETTTNRGDQVLLFVKMGGSWTMRRKNQLHSQLGRKQPARAKLKGLVD